MSGKQAGLFQHATSAQSRQTQRAAAFFVRLKPETSPIVSGAGVYLSSMGVTGLNIATVATELLHESKGKWSKEESLTSQEVTLTVKSTRGELLEQWSVPHLIVWPTPVWFISLLLYSKRSKITFSLQHFKRLNPVACSCVKTGLNWPLHKINLLHWRNQIWIKWIVTNAYQSLLLSARFSS